MRVNVEESIAQQSGKIRMTLSFDEADLSLTYTPFGILVDLEGCIRTGEVGGPGLPVKVIRMALPPMTRADGAKGRALKSILVTDKPVFIAPLQLPRPGIEDKQPPGKQPNLNDDSGKNGEERVPIKRSISRPVEQPFIAPFAAPQLVKPKLELYESASREPRPLARLIAIENPGLLPVAVVEVSPLRVIEDGRLQLTTEMEIEVSYMQDRLIQAERQESITDQQAPNIPKVINSRSQAQRQMELTMMQVVNPEMVHDISSLFPVFLTQVDYLIITDNQTWDEKSMKPTGKVGDLTIAFNRLAEWKAKRGLKTKVVTISEIVSGKYGNFAIGALDLQEVIRNYIKWAYLTYGISWILLGGDISIIPVRRVPGASEGHINLENNNPPQDNRSFWTGSYLQMKLVNPGVWWPGNKKDHLLVQADTGLLIPYDASGTSGPASRGWYFTTDETYAQRSTQPTQYVKVNGPEAEVKGLLQWLYIWNVIPTDLYYSSLVGPNYNLPGKHDWDLLDNAIYGQHNDSSDFDGVSYQADISVGRAPVDSPAQANAFVDKVISYERFRKPNGSLLDINWPRRVVIAASNWGGRIWIPSTNDLPPSDDRYHQNEGQNYSLIKLRDVPSDFKWRLFAQLNDDDVRMLPYNMQASISKNGWFYAKSATDLTPSEILLPLSSGLIRLPWPSNWVVIYGSDAVLSPQFFIFDRIEQDGSMRDQEQLREQISTELSKIDKLDRYYEDEVDLTPDQIAVAPVDHLTSDHMRNALNSGPHFLSLSGHGNPDGCCSLDKSIAGNLSNGFHSFVCYADSCLTNQFDGNDAFSESLIYNQNGGAVAYIGSSRFSWIGIGDNFQRAFFHRLTSTRHLGLANDIRASMVNEPTGFYRLYNKWTIFSMNLMGDPEMPIWIGSPKNLSIELVKPRPLTIEVKSSGGGVVSGAIVHIQKDNKQSMTGISDQKGIVSFGQTYWDVLKAELTVSCTDFIPYIQQNPPLSGPMPIDLGLKEWGSYYSRQGFDEHYFAGYVSGSLCDRSKDKDMASGQLGRVLQNRRLWIGGRESLYLSLDDPIELEEGFELAVKGRDGINVYLELSRNGTIVDAKVLSLLKAYATTDEKTYYYKRNLGNASGVVTIAVHFGNVISWYYGLMLVVDSIWQLSDSVISY